jgi:protoporphyrinogen oxidase
VSENEEKYVIVGSGSAALAATLFLISLGLGKRTVLVEPSEKFGGLLGKFEYEKFGIFDIGMHNIMETGDPLIDDLIFGAMPGGEWNILSGDRRDLAGLGFKNSIQAGSPYLNLASETVDPQSGMLKSFLSHLGSDGTESIDNVLTLTAQDYLTKRFGTVAARPYLDSIQRTYGKTASELSQLACSFKPMDRVIIGDEETTRPYYSDPKKRSVIAWPEQRTLPLTYSSGLKSLYPRDFGMYRYVDAVLKKLEEAGGQIIGGHSIARLDFRGGKIDSLSLRNMGTRTESQISVRSILWTLSQFQLGQLLNLAAPSPMKNESLETWICNFIVRDQPTKLGDLYYLFSHDQSIHSHRITNFSAYCPEAITPIGYPIASEILIPRHGDSGSSAERDSPLNLARRDLEVLGISASEDIVFARAEKLGSGFPMPTVSAQEFSMAYRSELTALGIFNLRWTGIQPEKAIFFQPAVTRDSIRCMKELINV